MSSDNGGSAELAAQVQRLSDEVEDLRAEQAPSPSRNETRARPDPGSSLSARDPSLSAIFIFKDGRRISAQNYAIAGQTLWILDEHNARKFALDQIDADATQQVNAANGLDMRLPAPSAKP